MTSRKCNSRQQRQLAAFLPALLEIQQTPPHPLPQWLGRALMALFMLALLWALLGKVNIVASAEGKIIPSSRVKYIQPLEKAVVERILVSEGQWVTQGQALIELDRSLTGADLQSLQAELANAQLQQAIAQAMLKGLEDNTLVIEKHEDALYQRLLQQHWHTWQSQWQQRQHAAEKNQAEQAATRANLTRLQKTLPLLKQRLDKLAKLLAKKHVKESDYLRLKQEHISTEQEQRAEEQRLRQHQAAGEEIKQQQQELRASSRSQWLEKLAEQRRQIATLSADKAKADSRNAKRTLYAPVSGQVQDLAIHTIGGVVTDAQQLMRIVPAEQTLEVEAILENKDIGFIHAGMPAEVKIHTFPFTRYGLLHGHIRHVAQDATVDEQKGLIYRFYIQLDSNQLQVNGNTVDLLPGMGVTAEVQTGKRRIIEFFLAPLLRYRQEGLRER